MSAINLGSLKAILDRSVFTALWNDNKICAHPVLREGLFHETVA